jgi:hypothetical protein
LNRIAPVILVVLLAVAVLQLRSGFGGGGLVTEGEVSEADLLEETTTTVAQRTFVTLSPVSESPQVATTRGARAAGPSTSQVDAGAVTTQGGNQGGSSTTATPSSDTVTSTTDQSTTTRDPASTRPPTSRTTTSRSSTTDAPTTVATTPTSNQTTTTARSTTQATSSTSPPPGDGD